MDFSVEFVPQVVATTQTDSNCDQRSGPSTAKESEQNLATVLPNEAALVDHNIKKVCC